MQKQADAEQELLFICEGVFDAISIEEQGLKAISLNSTSNTKRLIEAIKKNIETAKTYKYIIATDTDEARTKSKRGTTSRTNKVKHSKKQYRDTLQSRYRNKHRETKQGR